jgi:hypothetical protein
MWRRRVLSGLHAASIYVLCCAPSLATDEGFVLDSTVFIDAAKRGNVIRAPGEARPAECPPGDYYAWNAPDKLTVDTVIADCETGETYKLSVPEKGASVPAGAMVLHKWFPKPQGPNDGGPKALEK